MALALRTAYLNACGLLYRLSSRMTYFYDRDSSGGVPRGEY